MRFSEFVAKNQQICFTDDMYVLLPIYMDSHNWKEVAPVSRTGWRRK